jgi:hypothetical protein
MKPPNGGAAPHACGRFVEASLPNLPEAFGGAGED